jgi:dTDP-D-glucose 4,6-dehydratase
VRRAAHPAGWYHCSSAASFTVFDVIDLVARALNVSVETEHVPDRAVQDRAYAMDPSRLHSYGWRPRRAPAEAIGHAAQALYAAWSGGEDLRTRRVSQVVRATQPRGVARSVAHLGRVR